MSTPETESENDWSFPRSEARATVVLGALLPAGAAVVFAGFTGEEGLPTYVIVAFIATFAVGACLAVLIGLAQRRRGRSPWRGRTWEDFRALQAAAKQSGWPSTPIWLVIVALNAVSVAAFINTWRSIGSG